MKDDWDIFDNEIQKAIVRARRISNEYVKPYIKQLAIYERALELACNEIQDMYCNDYCMCTKEQFLDQAKKELEEEDV